MYLYKAHLIKLQIENQQVKVTRRVRMTHDETPKNSPKKLRHPNQVKNQSLQYMQITRDGMWNVSNNTDRQKANKLRTTQRE